MLQHSGPNGGACPSHGEALPQGRPAPLPRKYKTSLGLAQADFTSPEQGQCVGGGTQSPHPQGIISAGDDKAGLAGSRPNVGGGGPQLPQEDGRSPPPSEWIIFSPCPSREGKGSIGAPALMKGPAGCPRRCEVAPPPPRGADHNFPLPQPGGKGEHWGSGPHAGSMVAAEVFQAESAGAAQGIGLWPAQGGQTHAPHAGAAGKPRLGVEGPVEQARVGWRAPGRVHRQASLEET